MDIKSVISQMTLEEKASMCSGADHWRTKSIERLGIPSIMMADGPHGLRLQAQGGDHLGMTKSKPSTCYPTIATLACSWDRDLARKVGAALGNECQSEGISILLAPGVNLKRTPLCGRNFEYFSEDPYLTSQLATPYIHGVQSQGVGTSLKHFAANNQEYKRYLVDSVIDERTLRELYLSSFEEAVRQSQPWTVMCAYNRLNGTYCSEHHSLLTDILKNEWGHEGFVVSDWGAVNERAIGLAAGLELEMPPGSYEGDKTIVQAVRNGSLAESVLDKAVERLLNMIFKAVSNRKTGNTFDMDAHHMLAREVARESMVLLKNENQILPLKKEGTLAVIGAFAESPRFQGGGSSHVVPTRVDNALSEIKKIAGPNLNVLYAEGYKLDSSEGRYVKNPFKSVSDNPDDDLINYAKEVAAKSETAIIFAGLPESYETEGTDRKHLEIPDGQRKLITAVSEVQKNVVVVLFNGAPIEMPWLDQVQGVLEGYLGGQASGGAVADLLFGEANPCGKLAETFPAKLKDTPCYLNVTGDERKVHYSEGLFIGYRHYDAKEIEPLFPFGFGLSYTQFEYTGISTDKKKMSDRETLTVRVTVKNIGGMAGKEIVQLYVRDVKSSVIRPQKELKGFEKVYLQPGEEKTITFELSKRAFSYYNVDIKDWCVEGGEYEILAGKSSREIVLKETVDLISTTEIKIEFTRNSTFFECMSDPTRAHIMEPLVQRMVEKFNLEPGSDRATNFLKGMPLRVLIPYSKVPFSEEELEEVLRKLNA